MTKTPQQLMLMLIAVHVDCIEQYLKLLTPNYRQEMKQRLNLATKHVKLFLNGCNTSLEDAQEAFGMASDEIREMIEEKVMEAIYGEGTGNN